MNRIKFFLTILFAQIIFSFSTTAQKQFKALLITTTNGWRHESVHAGVLAIQQLAIRNFFDVVYFDDPKSFTDKNLEQFQVVIFLNTTGDIFFSDAAAFANFHQHELRFVGQPAINAITELSITSSGHRCLCSVPLP